MLEKNLGLQERYLFKLENIDYHTLNDSQNLKILSLVFQLPNLGCFVKENFRNL